VLRLLRQVKGTEAKKAKGKRLRFFPPSLQAHGRRGKTEKIFSKDSRLNREVLRENVAAHVIKYAKGEKRERRAVELRVNGGC